LEEDTLEWMMQKIYLILSESCSEEGLSFQMRKRKFKQNRKGFTSCNNPRIALLFWALQSLKEGSEIRKEKLEW